MAIKIYTKEFSELLPKIFKVKAHFLRAFGGKLQTRDGVEEKDNYMEVKVTDTEVVVQNYSTDDNTAFGTGTANSNRFGERKEIKSTNKQVPYKAPLAIHEGVDALTVNDNADDIIEERSGLHAEAWIGQVNKMLGKSLSSNAGKTLTGTFSEDGITKVFNDAHKDFTNNLVSKEIAWVAYVNTDVYNLLADHKLLTTAKGSTVNIDKQYVEMFKGFVIEEVPDANFESGDSIYFAADNVGVAGVGVQVYRLLDSEQFAGVAIQSAAKYVEYIPDINKKAIEKAKLTGTGGI